MKKLVLLAGAVFLIALGSCGGSANQKKNDDTVKNQTKLAAASDTIRATLDGIPEEMARPMFEEFKKAGLSTYKTRQTWYHIDMTMFKAMIKMLNKEKASEHHKPGEDGEIDGIRIYFINNPRDPSCPTISFVATRDSSNKYPPTSNPDMDPSKHRDYYIHNRQDSLYRFVNRNVDYGHDDDGGGAKLFLETPPPSSCPTSDDVKPDDAREMVSSFVAKSGEYFNTRSVWYRLELFKDVFRMPSDGGVRFYLCSHTHKDVGRHTFLILPTNRLLGGPGKYKDDYSDHSCFSSHWNKSPGKDNGELCPNHCN